MTDALPVLVLPTGTSNVASMLAALGRVAAPRLVEHASHGGPDPDRVRDSILHAERLVVPGVGAFAAARSELVARGAWGPLRERVLAGRPTLLVCLGLQLLADASDESPGAAGLGVVRGVARRFRAGPSVRVPQLGWNHVDAGPDCRLLASGDAYFANSYFLGDAPAGWATARAQHGESFVAAMERGRVLACQFHPELSASWGEALLARWIHDEPRAPSLEAPRASAGSGPTSRIIPCLDVKDGRVVKGIQFQGLRDGGDPAERAALYEAEGADEIVILDVSATPEARKASAHTVEAVRARLSIPLTVGGGVREPGDVKRLLDAGADKVAANTAAFDEPALIDAMAQRFGRQCTVIAIDAARREGGGWEVVTRSGKHRTGADVIAWSREAAARGAGEVLLTSFDRDGTKSGYDLELLREVTQHLDVPVIASGGASTVAHMADAIAAGADAVLAASIFHDNETTPRALKDELAALGVRVRR